MILYRAAATSGEEGGVAWSGREHRPSAVQWGPASLCFCIFPPFLLQYADSYSFYGFTCVDASKVQQVASGCGYTSYIFERDPPATALQALDEVEKTKIAEELAKWEAATNNALGAKRRGKG